MLLGYRFQAFKIRLTARKGENRIYPSTTAFLAADWKITGLWNQQDLFRAVIMVLKKRAKRRS